MTKDKAPDPVWENAALTCFMSVRRLRVRTEASLGAIEEIRHGS